MHLTNIFKILTSKFDYKTNNKQLLILSDDWGSVRIHSRQDQEVLMKKGLTIDNRFDKFDCLETNKDMELLFEVLIKYKDHQGNHPVITAVTNVGNPDFEKIAASDFKTYSYETIDQTYQRYTDSDRVLSLFKQGIDQRIFIPQSHGREHVQINWWMNELQEEHSFARRVFENEFFFVPPSLIKKKHRNRGFSAAFDVMTQNDIDIQKEIIATGLNYFNELFGYQSTIFTPPGLIYNSNIEVTLFEHGIRWLDVGRFLRLPKVGGGEAYEFNFLGRKKKSGVRSLVRNGVFEPNLLDSENGVNRALFDIHMAFEAKKPAILSNHRAAFVGRINVDNRNNGLAALDELINKALRTWPDIEFVGPKELFDNMS